MNTTSFYDVCAAFYDDDYAVVDRPDDAAFYATLARAAGGPVLEMGCGSGRVLLPCARACAEARTEIVGLDLSPAMLQRVERRLADESPEVRHAVSLIEGDIRHTAVREPETGEPRTFSLVTAPFRVIQHLVEVDDQRAWLANVRRHLAPGGGVLVFDVFQPDFQYMVGPAATVVDVERTDPATGDILERHATAWHTPELQTFRVRFEWRRRRAAPEADPHADADESELLAATETVTRWFTYAELTHLLACEGFRVTDAWGDFERTPFGPGAEDIVLRAVRA